MASLLAGACSNASDAGAKGDQGDIRHRGNHGGTSATGGSGASGGTGTSGGTGGGAAGGTTIASGGSGGSAAGGKTSGSGGSGATGGSSGATGTSGTGPGGLPVVPGEPDTSVNTKLPALPRLPNVTATATGDSVELSVEPVAGAKDYRVYVLPADSDVTPGSDGQITVKNAIYRCGGNRQSPAPAVDVTSSNDSWVLTQVDNITVQGYKRSLAEATLGHVYVTPGDGRVPIYAMGDPAGAADNNCYDRRWAQSRVKKYVTQAEHDDLLTKKWRDDGIAFYVPADGTPGTHLVHTLAISDGSRLYYADGPEATKRGAGQAAFSVLDDETPGDTEPLMRVFYQNNCGNDHDELAPGESRFERARYQGDALPQFDLHWSGITGPTTLVVEALDVTCPYGGAIAPVSAPKFTSSSKINYEPWITLDDAQKASPTGEVFINGQGDPANKPRPIARSFVKVSPGPKPDMDWYLGFGDAEKTPDFSTYKWDTACGDIVNGSCYQEFRQASDFGDLSFDSVETPRYGLGAVLGELWVMYADVAADTGGKFRFTPNTKGKIGADSYLHVTMEVDAFTTGRRYPQMLISDVAAPVQWNMSKGNTVIVQTFHDDGTANWPHEYQFQVCDHRNWDVNNQCPSYDLYRVKNSSGQVTALMPNAELAEHTGVDRSTHFDAYVSTKRAYLFLDNEPYGCAELPSKGVPSGDVTVTFGDVLYHSGVDSVFSYHKKYQQTIARRHFDNLGFKSGVPAPMWDESRLPCAAASTIGMGAQ
jgi:hypothetical protein